MNSILNLLAALALLFMSVAKSFAAGEVPFLKRIYTNTAGGMLRYRLLLPQNVDSSKSYPVILFLHGAGARGDDNEDPLNWGPRLIQESLARDHLEAILVVPQCPKGEGWTGSSIFHRTEDALTLTLELIRDVLPKELNVDAKRRYLTGVSMGGIALWGYLSEHPGFFAAGVPVCAAGSPGTVTVAAARFPIWAFHSDDDHLVSVESEREMVKAWKSKGGVAHYTEYTGLKHSSWKKAYVDVDLFRWLLSQKLP